MNSNKGLGRGLDALFNYNSHPGESTSGANSSPEGLLYLSVNSLTPNPNQPREFFSDASIADLASSMKEQGILQPLLARQVEGEAKYQIIAGERRWRAAQHANIQTVPVIVKNIDDRDVLVVALMENLQREDLNPIEEARAFQALQEEMGLSQEEMGEKLGLHRGTISNAIRLLKLDEQTRLDIIEGRLSAGHARCLLSLPPGKDFDKLKKHIIATGMNVRDTEAAVNFWRTENRFPWEKNGKKSGSPVDAEQISRKEIENLASRIGNTLNCKTKIRGNINRGRISLAYETNEQLFELLDKLGLSLTD